MALSTHLIRLRREGGVRDLLVCIELGAQLVPLCLSSATVVSQARFCRSCCCCFLSGAAQSDIVFVWC